VEEPEELEDALIAALIAEAESLGVNKLTWTSESGGWSCRASGRDVPPCEGRGKTGEEATREIVNFLRRIA
jgi:hypothetical protein